MWHTSKGHRARPSAIGYRRTDWPAARAYWTHSALHVLCGVIWDEWRVPVTAQLDPCLPGWISTSTPLPGARGPSRGTVNAEIAADRRSCFLFAEVGCSHRRRPHPHDPLIPSRSRDQGVRHRGLDKQADGAHTSSPQRSPVRRGETESRGREQAASHRGHRWMARRRPCAPHASVGLAHRRLRFALWQVGHDRWPDALSRSRPSPRLPRASR